LTGAVVTSPFSSASRLSVNDAEDLLSNSRMRNCGAPFARTMLAPWPSIVTALPITGRPAGPLWLLNDPFESR
jgi:hypothetical protein